MLDNRNMVRDIMNQKKELSMVENETLEEIAEKTARSYKKELATRKTNPLKVMKQYNTLSEEEEKEMKQITIRATQTNPEENEEFLREIPRIHLSWGALQKVNNSRNLMEAYAFVMLAIFEKEIPYEVEKRIICLDNSKDFIIFLNQKGQKWSTNAQTIMRSQLPELHHKLFEMPPSYSTFMER